MSSDSSTADPLEWNWVTGAELDRILRHLASCAIEHESAGRARQFSAELT